MTTEPQPSRRATQRAQIRTAILDAAEFFLRTQAVESFTVDALAERAGVARRTVHNHFASLNDVITAVGVRALSMVTSEFEQQMAATPAGDGSSDRIYTELAAALRNVDLPAAISSFSGAVAFEGPHIHGLRNVQETFVEVSNLLVRTAQERYPAAPVLDVKLLVGTLLHGIAIIASTWLEEHRGEVDATSRQRWSELLEHLFSQSWVGREPGCDHFPVQ